MDELDPQLFELIAENGGGTVLCDYDWTRDLLIKYLEQGHALKKLPDATIERYKRDTELMKIAVHNNPCNFKYTTKNKEWCVLALRSAKKFDAFDRVGDDSSHYFDKIWSRIPDELRNEPDIIMELILNSDESLKASPQEIRHSKTAIIRYMLKFNSGNNYEKLPKNVAVAFKDDPDIIHILLKLKSTENIPRFATPMLVFSPKFVRKALKYIDYETIECLRPLLIQNYDRDELCAQFEIKLRFKCGF